MEVWKQIKDYPNYEVSNLGRIKSLRFGKEKIMKLNLDTRGYFMVPLRENGIRKTKLVHQLVLKAFVDKPKDKKCVNHINGIKTDNNVNNLEWCTQKENIIHAHNNGLCSDKKGTFNGRALLTEKQVLEIRNSNIKPLRLLAEKYNVSWSCISGIIKRKTWNHI
jgi:hypothetical protein